MDTQITSPFYATGNLYGAKPRTNPRSEGLDARFLLSLTALKLNRQHALGSRRAVRGFAHETGSAECILASSLCSSSQQIQQQVKKAKDPRLYHHSNLVLC
jgi:hypothetical protein